MALRPFLLDARRASKELAKTSLDQRNAVLRALSHALRLSAERVLEANRLDVVSAPHLSRALIDRLSLNEERIRDVALGLEEIASLPDPLGLSTSLGRGRSGIGVSRVRVPLGVVAIVYEARPNVTIECAALTLKSGNAVVLRGGIEAMHTNQALMQVVHQTLEQQGLPLGCVTFVDPRDRALVVELLGAVGLVDLVIPRGGQGLMDLVDAHAKVPVIRHGQGICHVYIDASADPSMAVEVAFNSKAQRPGVCNAMETLLVHPSQLAMLEPLGRRLGEKGFELRADEASRRVLEHAGIASVLASPADFDTEFLGPILAIKTVSSVDEALAFIAEHGTHHTASIVTSDTGNAERFLAEVDASCVLWNASTRLNDGGELGLGAEMGISTSKLHAYGPMGLVALTTEKLVVRGQGQIRT